MAVQMTVTVTSASIRAKEIGVRGAVQNIFEMEKSSKYFAKKKTRIALRYEKIMAIIHILFLLVVCH